MDQGMQTIAEHRKNTAPSWSLVTHACGCTAKATAGVAMGGCVKLLFAKLCPSSYVFFTATKPEKTKSLLCFNFRAFIPPNFSSVPQAVQPRRATA